MPDTGSLAYNFLLKVWPLRRNRIMGRVLAASWKHAEQRFRAPVKTTLHGQKVTLNFGYTYPLNVREHPTFNDPLLELAYQTYQASQTPLVVVDVGAAVGDTMLLLRANCGEFISRYVCVDGDREFLGYLRANAAPFGDVTIVEAFLSESTVLAPGLTRTHAGTASAQGSELVQTTTFDDAMLAADRIDLVKIDVDGFDGRVLAGARKTLARCQPAIIFEWHPILYEKTGGDLMQPFLVLEEAGYQQFVWFDKAGRFSHFTGRVDDQWLRQTAALCTNNRFQPDWHYDVVALPASRAMDPVRVAECQYARACRSRR